MAATTSSEQKSFGLAGDEREENKEAMAMIRKRLKPGRTRNGVIKGDTRSLYISPSECT